MKIPFELPAPFAPEMVSRPRDIVPHALVRAAQGAPEGTLLWHPEDSWDRHTCAVILQPRGPAAEAGELRLVATVAAAIALADLMPPMVTLGLSWPGGVALNGRDAIEVHGVPGPLHNGVLAWLVVALTVHRDLLPPPDEGLAGPAAHHIVTGFARQLVLWLDRWSQEGMAPVARQFAQRLANRDRHVTFRLHGATVAGTLTDIDADGHAQVTYDQRVFSVPVEKYVECPPPAGAGEVP